MPGMDPVLWPQERGRLMACILLPLVPACLESGWPGCIVTVVFPVWLVFPVWPASGLRIRAQEGP